MNIILIICSVITGVCIFLLSRNNRVLEERLRFLQILSTRARESIARSEDWRHHYAVLEEHSYEEMLFKFWKPVKSFYKGK